MLSSSNISGRLIDAQIAASNTIVPCTADDLKHTEDSVQLRLPTGYREFLLAAGRCAGILLEDCDWLYPEIVSLTGDSRRMLRAFEGDGLTLPATAFVCLDRRESFLFFDTDDPCCNLWQYYEESGEFVSLETTFWQFLDEAIGKLAGFIAKQPDSKYWKTHRRRAEHRANRMH